MGGLWEERCEEGRRGGRMEEDKRQRRVEKLSHEAVKNLRASLHH